jgi:large subunit ribosomal protein L25
MSQDSIVLHVEPRDVTGKTVKHLRKDGLVPAVIHDHGKESVIVQGKYVDMFKAYQAAGKHHPIELKAGDRDYTVLIKVAEFEPRKNQLNHLVFNAVDKNQMVEAEVPVRARYDEGNEVSPAERLGLVVLEQLDAIEVKAIPSNIPDFVEYDAEKLVEVGDHVTVADLIIPADVEVVTEPEHAVATVYEPSALQAANEDAGGAAEAETLTAEGAEGESAEGEAAPVEAEKPEE